MLAFVFNKDASLHACNVIKMKLQHWYFSVKFAKFLILKINTDFEDHLQTAASIELKTWKKPITVNSNILMC